MILKKSIFLSFFMVFIYCKKSNIENKISVDKKPNIIELKKNDKVENKSIIIGDSLKVEDSIFRKIQVLKIVKERQTELKVSGFSYLIKEKPSEDSPYYWVQVGYDNSFRLEIVFNFYYSDKENKIYLYDAIEDKKILVD